MFKANVQKSLDSLERDAGNEAILGSFSRLRLVAALAKIDATVAIAKEILQKESSLVIFTFFVQVAKEVHRKLDESGWRGELLSGETASKNRQALVDRFQVC
jgi:superfamily II DNA or RNA helicase